MKNGEKKLKVLGLITARGGSKGVPGKNIRPLFGKPLIEWTILEANKSQFINDLVLSSDDQAIIDVAKSLGCAVPFVRPKEISGDEVPSVDVINHALRILPGYTHFILLQPTSPLRLSKDIDGGFQLMLKQKSSSCVSIKPSVASPHWMFSINGQNTLSPLLDSPNKFDRRQQLPDYFILNGAIYIGQVDWFLKNQVLIDSSTVGWIMPEVRSVDIDSLDDFDFAEFIMRTKKDEKNKES